jgi:hypothetical protein
MLRATLFRNLRRFTKEPEPNPKTVGYGYRDIWHREELILSLFSLEIFQSNGRVRSCAVPCPNGHLLIVIAIATENTHSILGNGLNEINQKYNSSRVKIVNGHLIFFTPTNSLLNFSPQRIVTHQGQEYGSEEQLNPPLQWFHANQYQIETTLEAELAAVEDNLSTIKQNCKKQDFTVYSMFTTATTEGNFPELAPGEDKFINYFKEETVIQNLLSRKNKRKLASLDQQEKAYHVPGYGHFFRRAVPGNGNRFFPTLAMGLGNVDH